MPQEVGLKVSDVVVLIDREQGGKARLAATGLALHSAFTLSYILEVLVRHGHVSAEVAAKVKEFIAANQTDKAAAAPAPALPKRWVRGAVRCCWGRVFVGGVTLRGVHIG